MSADTTPAAPEPSTTLVRREAARCRRRRPSRTPGRRRPSRRDRPAPARGRGRARARRLRGPAPGLTERERAILAFEQQWWRHAGAKEQAVRDTFGISSTRYYQLLNGLLDNPAALAADPVLISRLRRLRSSRARNRRR